ARRRDAEGRDRHVGLRSRRPDPDDRIEEAALIACVARSGVAAAVAIGLARDLGRIRARPADGTRDALAFALGLAHDLPAERLARACGRAGTFGVAAARLVGVAAAVARLGARVGLRLATAPAALVRVTGAGARLVRRLRRRAGRDRIEGDVEAAARDVRR